MTPRPPPGPPPQPSGDPPEWFVRLYTSQWQDKGGKTRAASPTTNHIVAEADKTTWSSANTGELLMKAAVYKKPWTQEPREPCLAH